MKQTTILAVGALLLALAGLASAGPYYVPDAELAHPGFAVRWQDGGSMLLGKLDLPGPGVAFAALLRNSGKLGIADDWPIEPAAGLAPDPGVPGGCWPHDNSSLADYTSYRMLFTYAYGPPGSDLDVNVFTNTGLTGLSAYPSWDWRNDTNWEAPSWVSVELGETVEVELDFAAAKAWGITDNPVPHTGGGLGWPDGGVYAINDRDLHEISKLGFQIADFDGDTFGMPVVVVLNLPEPTTLVLLGLGALPLLRRRR